MQILPCNNAAVYEWYVIVITQQHLFTIMHVVITTYYMMLPGVFKHGYRHIITLLIVDWVFDSVVLT